MPELPEVESLRRILSRSAVGRTIVSARIGKLPLRRRVTPDFGAMIAGRTIERISRRAKYLMFELSGDSIILAHLGMSGSITHRHDGFDASEFDVKHDHLEFALDDASRLVYNDPRRFGMVRLISRADLARDCRAEGNRSRAAQRGFQCRLPRASRRAEKKSQSRTSSWIKRSWRE